MEQRNKIRSATKLVEPVWSLNIVNTRFFLEKLRRDGIWPEKTSRKNGLGKKIGKLQKKSLNRDDI